MGPLILGGIGLAQGIAKLFGAKKQEKQLTGMVNSVGELQADEDVAGNVAAAKSMFNGRMTGAATAEQTILGNQSNTVDALERNALDSSQVLSMIGGVSGNANKSIVELATEEGKSQESRFGQVQGAIQMSNQDKLRVWQDRIRKLNQLMSIKGTRHANNQDAFSDIAGGLGMAAQAFGGNPNKGGGSGGGALAGALSGLGG